MSKSLSHCVTNFMFIVSSSNTDACVIRQLGHQVTVPYTLIHWAKADSLTCISGDSGVGKEKEGQSVGGVIMQRMGKCVIYVCVWCMYMCVCDVCACTSSHSMCCV